MEEVQSLKRILIKRRLAFCLLNKKYKDLKKHHKHCIEDLQRVIDQQRDILYGRPNELGTIREEL